MTLREALAHGTATLEKHHIPSPQLTAEVLLAHTMGRERVFLHAHPEDPLDAASWTRFLEAIERRSGREPLQYITGVQEFYGRPFRVDRTVLIPRPETELIVEVVLELNRQSAPRILDVGTGSGCLATTLALELPRSRVFASDLSLPALLTARHNARAHGVRLGIAVVDLAGAWRGPFDFIVSNPPYVEHKDGLPPEVGRHEPPLALFGQRAPVELYRDLIARSERILAPGGHLVLEIGFSMEPAVRELFDRAWKKVETRTDLQGIPRVVWATPGNG